jgi:hypothetical protein
MEEVIARGWINRGTLRIKVYDVQMTTEYLNQITEI